MTKLGVETVFLSGTQDFETQQRDVLSRLRQVCDHGCVKMLYITPEKLSRSGMIQGLFRDLSNRNLISRFVVDEAHCLRYVLTIFELFSHHKFSYRLRCCSLSSIRVYIVIGDMILDQIIINLAAYGKTTLMFL